MNMYSFIGICVYSVQQTTRRQPRLHMWIAMIAANEGREACQISVMWHFACSSAIIICGGRQRLRMPGTRSRTTCTRRGMR